MKRIAILSWPKGQSTHLVADKILHQFDAYGDLVKVDEVDFLSVNEKKLQTYDMLIIGGSTVGTDNWLIADNTTKWAGFFEVLRFADLSGKKAAVFALGNQVKYPENFADGMSVLKNVLEQKGAKIIGYWPTEDYDFHDSHSVEGDHFMGLVIDHETQPELTDTRIKGWVDQLVGEMI